MTQYGQHVSNVPISDITRLFDHLVGAAEQCGRNSTSGRRRRAIKLFGRLDGKSSSATCHGFETPVDKRRLTYFGVAGGIAGQRHRPLVAFGKSGKHRASKLAALVLCPRGLEREQRKAGKTVGRASIAILAFR
jgi:hypothetical protein